MIKILDKERNIFVVCEWKDRRNGFSHIVTLYMGEREFGKAKCNYVNRTWERFEYETCIKDAIQTSSFDDSEKEELLEIVRNL